MPTIPLEVPDEARLAALAAYDVLDTPAEQGFDDIVHLARRLCSTPVALVSFVDRDRQWFKARAGFPPCETDLDRSVCAHALAHPDDLLVIENLALDPRTRENPLVTGEPFIRFYAGAPLVTPQGQVLGSLCVIDTKPRPGGLMGSQADDLRALARQVIGQLEMRRAVAGRARADMRRAALLALGDRLRDLTSVPDMTRAAAEIVGHTLNLTRAGFGLIEGDVEAIEIEPDWTAPGTASIAGRHVFEDYGDIRGHLRRGEPLVIEDVRSDPRTAADPDAMLAVGIGALVNMPVRERGRTVAVFIAHDGKARHWTPEELAFLRNVADRVEVGVARVRAEELQTVLNGELAHRLKNTLSVVQSITSQTLKDVAEREPVEALSRRILALSKAHDVLLQKSWVAAKIRAVMEGVLTLQADLDRFALDGPDMDLTPQAALSLTMLLHELATNAVKYGALSSEAGTVRLSWRTEDGGAPSLVLDWAEAGGPAATAPTGRGGFGSKLIRMGLMGSRHSDVRYEPDGLRAEFRAPLAELQARLQ